MKKRSKGSWQSGTFAQLTQQIEGILPWVNVINNDTVTHNLTVTPAQSPAQWTASFVVPVAAGASVALPTDAVAVLVCDTAGSSPATVYWFYSDHPIGGLTVGQTNVTVTLNNPTIAGTDNRTGLTGTDGSPITIYTPSTANQLLQGSIGMTLKAGTNNATYTLAWTSKAVSKTKAISVSSTTSNTDTAVTIQPDSGTAVTVQLTAVGVGDTVQVCAALYRVL